MGNPSTRKISREYGLPTRAANVLTNKTKRHRKIHNSIQLNTGTPKQHNEHNKHKLTLICSYSYDHRSGSKVAPFEEVLAWIKEVITALETIKTEEGYVWPKSVSVGLGCGLG